MNNIGKLLIFSGIGLIISGLLVGVFSKWIPLGKLPGDIHYKSGQVQIFIPITTCVLISLIATGVYRLWSWFK